jgi:RNA-directed DNA polymerase
LIGFCLRQFEIARLVGIRPGRSIHTALKGAKFKFQGVKWCVKTSLESNFSNIDHKILLTILSRRISCSKFLALLKKSIKAGYIEDKNFVASNKGLLRESIISPILNNIYLHQLDLFVFNLVESFNKGKNRRKSPDFRHIQYHIGILTENHLKRRMRKAF